FCGDGEIQPRHLPKYLFISEQGLERVGSKNNDEPDKDLEELDSIPGYISGAKAQILAALRKARWNKQKAAQFLHIDRSTLWRRMKKHNIEG
ncbi:MAG: Sigma-54 factor interaction protein, partial [Acidobacteriota bacterium]|nr:Sigma-54 factor interaction protein [Acidobacteriota bacterium]